MKQYQHQIKGLKPVYIVRVVILTASRFGASLGGRFLQLPPPHPPTDRTQSPILPCHSPTTHDTSHPGVCTVRRLNSDEQVERSSSCFRPHIARIPGVALELSYLQLCSQTVANAADLSFLSLLQILHFKRTSKLPLSVARRC